MCLHKDRVSEAPPINLLLSPSSHTIGEVECSVSILHLYIMNNINSYSYGGFNCWLC